MEILDNIGIKLFVLAALIECYSFFVLYSASVSALQIVFSDSLYESTAKWDTSQIFKEVRLLMHVLTGASVTKMATLFGVSRAAVSRVMMTYTNHGRTSTKGNSSQKPKLGERNRHTLKGIVSVNHKSTTAKVTAELHIHLEHHFHKKMV